MYKHKFKKRRRSKQFQDPDLARRVLFIQRLISSMNATTSVHHGLEK